MLGHKSMSVICEWFPDALTQYAESITRLNPAGLEAPHVLSPDTHRIVWRFKPEVTWVEEAQRWHFYARFAFMPKEAWIVEESSTSE